MSSPSKLDYTQYLVLDEVLASGYADYNEHQLAISVHYHYSGGDKFWNKLLNCIGLCIYAQRSQSLMWEY